MVTIHSDSKFGPFSGKSTIVIKHEHNEFKSHSKSILNSFYSLTKRGRKWEKKLFEGEWSKNNFTSLFRGILWKLYSRGQGYEKALTMKEQAFPMAHQTQKAVNEVMEKIPKLAKKWIMKGLFRRHRSIALRTRSHYCGIKLICMSNSVTYTYIWKSMFKYKEKRREEPTRGCEAWWIRGIIC